MITAWVSPHIVCPDGVREGAVLVRGERVEGVVARAQIPSGAVVRDLGGLWLLPGLVDAHVHVNEPGRTEWEGFVTATRAAAAGGITAIVDMPLNCIPVTTTREALRIKRDAIADLLRVDVAFWAGVIPGNAGELDGLIDDGAVGAKCFLVHSGIDEFPNATEANLRLAMPVLARRGVPLLVHAELGEHLCEPPKVAPAKYAAWLLSRPRAAENEAIRFILRLARETGCRVHIVHLSSSDALPMLAEARREGVRVSAETCPHYLTLASEDVPDGRTEYKCAPPIRERENREKLWGALQEGTLDFVVSDHSPCTPHLKHLESGDFLQAWGGISSVQLGLPLVWTGARERGIPLETVVRWMSERTAAFAALTRKGAIAAGTDADLIVFDPDAEVPVSEAMIEHRHKLNPYLGRTLRGAVRETILRGQTVYNRGEFPGSNRGAFLRPTLHT